MGEASIHSWLGLCFFGLVPLWWWACLVLSSQVTSWLSLASLLGLGLYIAAASCGHFLSKDFTAFCFCSSLGRQPWKVSVDLLFLPSHARGLQTYCCFVSLVTWQQRQWISCQWQHWKDKSSICAFVHCFRYEISRNCIVPSLLFFFISSFFFSFSGFCWCYL